MKKNDQAAQLNELLKQLRASVEIEPIPERTPTEHLIYACLLWNTTRNQADQAFNRLRRATVDLNDLRVTDPLEIVEILGSRYSKAEERAQRMVMVLQGVYRIEHGMKMQTLVAMPKREARARLEEMPGNLPFISASVLLLGLGAHAIPVDDQLVMRLKQDGVVEEDATVEQVQSFLEHHIRAGDGLEAYQLLRPYAERAVKVSFSGSSGARGGSKPAGKAATSRSRSGGTKSTGKSKSKTTSKKTTTKKKSAAKR